MGYSSGVRFSRAKPAGSFRVLQASTRRVASHDETLKDARKSAAYWTSAVGSPMEIQERFPSGTWTTVETVAPTRRAHAHRKTHPDRSIPAAFVDPRGRVPIPAISSLKTTAETKRELAALRKEFEAQGGRGVDLAERIDELEADLEAGFQESISKKADWLKATKRRFPMGARVRVVKSDVPEYVGLRGTVTDYDLGSRGGWPTIGIKFDGPIKTSEWPAPVSRDSFYDDEIVLDRTKGKHGKGSRHTAVGHAVAAGPLRTGAYPFSAIQRGCRVTIVTPQLQHRTGTAVMRGPHGWVLNMGGKHGTPGIATESNTLVVRCPSPMKRR